MDRVFRAVLGIVQRVARSSSFIFYNVRVPVLERVPLPEKPELVVRFAMGAFTNIIVAEGFALYMLD